MAAACVAGTCGGVPVAGCVHDLGTSVGTDMTASVGDMASNGGADMTSSADDMTASGDLGSAPGADAGRGGASGNGCSCQIGGAPKDLPASTPLLVILFTGLLLRRRRPV
jgi:MYXO-CTERM domain-containing protein